MTPTLFQQLLACGMLRTIENMVRDIASSDEFNPSYGTSKYSPTGKYKAFVTLSPPGIYHETGAIFDTPEEALKAMSLLVNTIRTGG